MEVDVAEVLEKAADLIEPEGAWCQKAFVIVSGTQVVARCLTSAISKAAHGSCERGLAAMGFRYLGEATAWNDRHGRTQAEVVAKLRKAAALAREPSA